MLFRSSCSWCHHINDVTRTPAFCERCRHRSDLPRLECSCAACLSGRRATGRDAETGMDEPDDADSFSAGLTD